MKLRKCMPITFGQRLIVLRHRTASCPLMLLQRSRQICSPAIAKQWVVSQAAWTKLVKAKWKREPASFASFASFENMILHFSRYTSAWWHTKTQSHFSLSLGVCWISATTQVQTSGSLDLLRWYRTQKIDGNCSDLLFLKLEEFFLSATCLKAPTMQLTSTRRQFLRCLF